MKTVRKRMFGMGEGAVLREGKTMGRGREPVGGGPTNLI